MNFGILDCRLMVLAGPAIIRIPGLQFLRRVVIAGPATGKMLGLQFVRFAVFFFLRMDD